ncbi:acyl carrier protein [Actinacidiphila sp. ITFR-21]|uniref:acyl carrier protein n=1 Tax=Actinacidiphila sp. ITFR-21 TaxID=3075199 RepID=UPI00288B377E|nr:acyl carrier protein [Streptomyces sp. ITFR-21]WNI19413.1 acyl carrier protein [Streptomyces sp. ITFR-21]
MRALSREQVVTMLARFGDRAPEQLDEHIGSLELTWLLAELEQEHDVEIDLTEHQFDSVHTIDDAVAVLSAVLEEAATR